MGSFQDLSYKLNEDGSTREIASVKNTYYVYDAKFVRSAASIGTSWDTNGDWKSSDIALCTKIGTGERGHGITYIVRKKSSGFAYQIKGSGENLKAGETQYDSGEKTFAFADGKYSSDDIKISSDQTGLYSTYATIAYDDNARTIPVDFVLNDDGGVSFGEHVFAWAKQWRDYIVQTDAKSEIYEE